MSDLTAARLAAARRSATAVGGGLSRLVAEVVGAAATRPDEAPAIYQDAARTFDAFAQRQTNPRAAALLARHAADFAARARAHAHASLPSRVTVSDFDELERETAVAHAMGLADDLEMKAAQNAIHESRHGRDRISIAPQSLTEKTLIGNSVTCKFAPTSLDTQNNIAQESTVILWQGSPVESQTWTVDLDVIQPPDPAAGASVRPFARVQFAAGGFRSPSIKIDVGQRITGASNFLSVSVGCDAPGFGAPSAPIGLGASLGFFAAPSTRPVYLTDYADALGPGASLPFVRPAKAVEIGIVTSSDPTGAVQIDFLDSRGAVVTSVLFAMGSQVAAIPLSADIFSIVLTNKSATTPANFRIPWILSW